jgi:hypothetical protein
VDFVPVEAVAAVLTDRGPMHVLHIWKLAELLEITTESLQTLHTTAHLVQPARTCIQAMLAIAGNTYRIRQLDQ